MKVNLTLLSLLLLKCDSLPWNKPSQLAQQINSTSEQCLTPLAPGCSWLLHPLALQSRRQSILQAWGERMSFLVGAL